MLNFKENYILTYLLQFTFHIIQIKIAKINVLSYPYCMFEVRAEIFK